MTGNVADYTVLCSDLLAQPVWAPPALEPSSDSHTLIPFDDLVEVGAITVHEAPPTVSIDGGDTPMLSPKDVRLGRAPSRWGNAGDRGAVILRKGDVAVAFSTQTAVRVCTDDGILSAPGIRVVRTDADVVDPHFLAGILRAAIDEADGGPFDLYEMTVPRIRLPEQRRYGAAFERLIALETEYLQQRVRVEHLVRTGFNGLAQGRLRPTGDNE